MSDDRPVFDRRRAKAYIRATRPEPAVLLRDTPEDRERLRGIVRDVMNEWLTVEPDIVPDDEWDNEADAIIAALRGEL